MKPLSLCFRTSDRSRGDIAYASIHKTLNDGLAGFAASKTITYREHHPPPALHARRTKEQGTSTRFGGPLRASNAGH